MKTIFVFLAILAIAFSQCGLGFEKHNNYDLLQTVRENIKEKWLLEKFEEKLSDKNWVA